MRPVRIEDDRGSLTAAVVIWTPVLLLLAAFVVDVGSLISHRDKADNIAEQAARRVADDLNQDALRQDPPWMIVNARAGGDCADDAKDFLTTYTRQTGDQVTFESCQVTGNPAAAVPGQAAPPAPVVTVRVTIQSKLLFAAILTTTPQTVTGTGTARPVGG